MAFVVVAAVFLLTTVGVYLLLARRALPTILGLALLGHAVNLIVLAAGRVREVPPLLNGEAGGQLTERMADPMPQALVLTAIVISMAVTLYLIAVMGVSAKQQGAVDVPCMAESDEGRDEVRRELGSPSREEGR